MNQLNQIEAADITRLDQAQMVRLLHTLLCSEARQRNVNKSGIHVPFEINVKDGGSDGKWDGDIEPNDYIPNKLTFYQSKAQELGPAQCADEIHKEKSTELKSQVKAVLDAGGAYVFFCSHPYNPDLIASRITKAREALQNAGRPTWEIDSLHFLDATLIAQWTNLHAAAFAYVCRCARISQAVGLRDYHHWRHEKSFQVIFQSNETLDGFIRQIREALSVTRGIARITGPSGLGKTRLGFEVFNQTMTGAGEKIREVLAASVAYCDMEIHGKAILGWVEQLCLAGYSGAIVVDNCSLEDHRCLQKMIEHPACRLSLLTLDYVPERPFGNSISHVGLTPEVMRDVVPKILEAIPGLPERLGGQSGISRISTFAHGFPQIAILTAEAEQALDWTMLNQQGALADRLLWGRDDNRDPQAKEFVRCLSVFTEVGVSGRHAAQFEFFRAALCSGISAYDFNRATGRFRQNRVIQVVGDFMMVSPPPLAVALAAEWLNDIPDEDLLRILSELSQVNLVDSFCKRLQQLDFSDRAKELSEKLMGPNGPFADAEVLNSEVGSRVFRSLSEVNPLAATDCLYRVLAGRTSSQLSEQTGGRRDLVWALEKLVWSEELFPKAARVVMALAGAETETCSNNATGLFCQLFHVGLPGTRCPLMNRLEVVREGLASGEATVRTVCVKALGEALESNHFSRTSGPEHRGTRPSETDYQPATYPEIWAYWKDSVLLLKGLIFSGDALSAEALDVLGNRLGTVLSCPLAREIEGDIKAICDSRSNYWASAREELKRFLEILELNKSAPNPIAQRWLQWVTPMDLRNRLINIVCSPGWHHREDSSGKFIDLSREAVEKLAEELARTGEDWFAHIDCLLEGTQQETWHFGRKLLELSSDAAGLFERCLEAYRNRDPKQRVPQLLRGMLNFFAGTKFASEILDRIASDDNLREELLLPLTTAAAMTVADFTRVSTLIISGKLPPTSIDQFSYASVTEPFDRGEFIAAMEELTDKVPESAPYVLHIVSMYCHHREAERMASMSALLEKLLVIPELVSTVGTSSISFAWKTCAEGLLKNPPEGFVKRLSSAVIEALEKKSYFLVEDSYISGIANRLLCHHSAEAWPVFAGALRKENGEPRFAVVELLARTGRYGDAKTPIWELPEPDFRAWADSNRDLLPHFLGRIPLYVVEKVESSASAVTDAPDEGPPFDDETAGIRKGERYVWHPYAQILVELCGRDALQDALASNLFSFGSVGSRVPYLQRRAELVGELARSADPDLKRIAETLLESLEAAIAEERKRDEQYAAGIYTLP